MQNLLAICVDWSEDESEGEEDEDFVSAASSTPEGESLLLNNETQLNPAQSLSVSPQCKGIPVQLPQHAQDKSLLSSEEHGNAAGRESAAPLILGNNSEFRLAGSIAERLYPHQREGITWLWSLYREQCGGILGDDMGMGKTMQCSAFLAGMLQSKLIKWNASSLSYIKQCGLQ